MPLHLLHHKSYHVYSTTNIERVRRDEAAARAKEEAEEQRMQEADAEHRMKILRARAGERATTPPLEERPTTASGRFVAPKDSPQIGGDETAVRQPTPPPPAKRRKASPKLIGSDGHINLFSEIENPRPQKKAEKNTEYEAEKKAKEDKLEAQYTMGLGKPADELRPWYSTLDMVGEVKGRKKTEWEIKKDERRKDWGDPLVTIKKGVRSVKEIEEERKEWKRSRELEVGALGFNGLNTERSSGVKRTRSRSREYRGNRDKSPRGHHYRSRHRSRSASKSGRHHHSHKHNRRESSTEQSSHRRHRTSESGSRRHRSPHEDTMEKLRKERDQREKDEREKAESMLKKEKEYRLPGWKAAEGGRYSSQFGIGEVRKR